jgi:hypothetical protein
MQRVRRESFAGRSVIHYGNIASANTVIKNMSLPLILQHFLHWSPPTLSCHSQLGASQLRGAPHNHCGAGFPLIPALNFSLAHRTLGWGTPLMSRNEESPPGFVDSCENFFWIGDVEVSGA